ncbi:tetratricopeptide repeat protein [Luteolibacter yonseiensis]|uniref:Tetratricopeptide repeat protein n=1 Tax=Luteolibacter yonseiensis TaxID=1144680 RepID=A0A934VAN8_9BACT|nr:tetratricopeptide repeat protein [Luteolibacter yonseiensis]MBK1814569.1 tetratricopeptide repeat protein [Luteolibacter yonseiensis]
MRFPLPALGLACLIVPLSAHPDPGHTLAEIDSHLAESPDDPELLRRKAELFLQTGHVRQAIPVAVKALSISPDDPATLLLQARVSVARKNPENAITRLEEINRRFPRFADAWALMARLRHEAGNTDGAITAKLRQLETDDQPAPVDFLNAAAWLVQRAGSGDADMAVSLLDRGIGLFGNVIELQRSAIRLECSLGRHDAALRRVDTLVARYRPSVEFSLLRADIHEAAGRYRDAASACDSAIALLDIETESPPVAQLRESILRRKEENLGRP